MLLYCFQLNIQVKQFVSDWRSGFKIFSRKVVDAKEWARTKQDGDLLLGEMEDKEVLSLRQSEGAIVGLKDICHMRRCHEHEYNVDNKNYRMEIQGILKEDSMAEFVMDTLKYRKKLVLRNGDMLRKASLFGLVKNSLDGKKYICIGSEDEILAMRELFEYFGINAKFFSNESEVISKIEYTNDSEILFYSIADEEENLIAMLKRKGFKEKSSIKSFLTYLPQEIYDRNITMDVNLGYNFCFKNSKYIGFKEYGNWEMAKYKIVALGNSTTDAVGDEIDESWPYFLYKRLNGEFGADICVMNGGAAAYNISDELIKFIRDVSLLRPNLVISYTGWINIAQKNEYAFINPWNRVLNTLTYVKENQSLEFGKINQSQKCEGILNNTGRYQYFFSQARMLHACAKSLGIRYECFVQPNIYTKKDLNTNEMGRMIYYESIHERKNSNEFFREMHSEKRTFEWLHDYSKIFDDVSGVYSDTHHVNGKGNQIIAEHVFLDILPYVHI